MANRAGTVSQAANHEGNLEQALREMAREPGGTGVMYEGWVADQNSLRQQKNESGTYMTPFDRSAAVADEEVRMHLDRLAELLAKDGQSPADALKAFFRQLLSDGISPADPGVDYDFPSEDQKEVYGKAGRAVNEQPSGDGAVKAAKAVHTIEHEEDDEEDEEDARKESKAVNEALERLTGVLEKFDKRLSVLEERLSGGEAGGRSVEATRAASGVSEAPVSQADGVWRRGSPNNAVDLAVRFAAKAIEKVQQASNNPFEFHRLRNEAADAISQIQAGGKPLLHSLALIEVAEELGIPYTTAAGQPVLGGDR